MSTFKGINRWKIGSVEAFGAGMTEDDYGNKIYDVIESVYTYDRGKYGRVLLYSSDEDTFQSQTQNQDVDGDPDYANNYLTSSQFTMKITVTDEVVHSVISDSQKSPTSFTSKCHPIIKNYSGQSCRVINANGDTDYCKKVNLTFDDIDSDFDRLGDLATNSVAISVTNIDGDPVELYIGQKIVFTYTFFTHTDTLRDLDSSTFWSTQDSDIDSYIIFDLNPYGSNSTIVYNNIELIMRDIPFSTGPYEYILQGASVLANTRQRYKHISSGYLPAKSEEESFVIKFDEVDYRYLKLVLIGSSNEDYNISDVEIRHSIAEVESTVTTTSNMNLALNCSGNIKIDLNPAYDIILSDYSLTDLSDVTYLEGMGLINMLYHKEYLNDGYSGFSYGIKSGDIDPYNGAIDFGYSGIYNIGTSGNSVGINLGASISGDCLIIRDRYVSNSGSLINDDDFRFFYSDTNSSFVEGSGFDVSISNNGFGSDIIFSNLDFNAQYLKLNYIGDRLNGGTPSSLGNNIDLMLSPTTNYLNVANPDYSYTDMFSMRSQINGSGSIIEFTEMQYDFVPEMFNRSVPTSGYSVYTASGNNYDVEDIYNIDASGNLSIEDFFLINAIPYYSDTESANTTVSKGVQVDVSEFTTDNRAKVYVSHKDNSGYPDRSLYKLMYYNLRYGTQLAYQGIPAKYNIFFDSKKVGSIRSQSQKGNTLCSVEDSVSLDLTQDIPQTTAVSNSSTLTLKFREAKDISAYAVSVIDPSIMTLLTYAVDYTVNSHTKKVVVSDTFESIYDNHYIAFEYEYPIFKYNLTKASPMKYFNFISNNYEVEKIQLSGIKIYPEQYFKSYEVNDQASVYTFEVNPASASISNEMNAAMVKLLDGGYRRDTFSPRARLNIKVNFPKITEEMRLKLISWYENGEVIGLVDDLKMYREGFIVPGSFNTPRRKTTKSEQEQETSSYSADFAFQER